MSVSVTEKRPVFLPCPLHFSRLHFPSVYLGKELEFKANAHDPPLELSEFLVLLQALNKPLVEIVGFQRDG